MNSEEKLNPPASEGEAPQTVSLLSYESAAAVFLQVHNGASSTGTTAKNLYMAVDENNTILKSETDPKFPSKIVPFSSINSEKQKGWRKFRGILLAILAAMQFSLSALIIKVLNYHPFNLGVWRFFVMALIPVPFIIHAVCWKKQNILKSFQPMNSALLYLVMQAVIGANALVLLFFALDRLNVADCLVISTSAPVFVTFLAFLFLGERLGLFPVGMAVLTLCGVGVISRPPILTSDAVYNDRLMIGVALSFSSMMCLAVNYVILRHLRTVHHSLVNLAFSLWGFVQCVGLASYFNVLNPPENFTEVLLILATAFLAFFAQTCITLALKYEEAGPVSLVRTTEVLFAFLWQLAFLGVVPDMFSMIGALLVLSAVILTATRKILIGLPADSKYKKLFWLILV